MARDCDVTIEDSDNPHLRCNFHSMKELEVKTDEELHNLSFRKIIPYNSFTNIFFGSNPYGINGATPADPLHQINLGIVTRLPEIFLTRLSTSLVKIIDSHVAYISSNFANQSD